MKKDELKDELKEYDSKKYDKEFKNVKLSNKDELLNNIKLPKDGFEFFEQHPSYLPFVGEEYEKYRILQIGETHYLGQQDKIEFGLDYFINNWFSNSCERLHKKEEYNRAMDTRGVINNWINEKKHEEENNMRKINHSIFREFVKAFGIATCGWDEKTSVKIEDTEKTSMYRYFAYTDFFVLPCIVGTKSVKSGLKMANEKAMLNKKDVKNFYNDVVELSKVVLNEVVNILKPELIVITSKVVCNILNDKDIKDLKIPVVKLYHPEARDWSKNDEHGKKALIEAFEKYLKK